MHLYTLEVKDNIVCPSWMPVNPTPRNNIDTYKAQINICISDMTTEILLSIGMAFVWAFWIMIPAYIPNPAAALVGGGTPIDFGKCAKDGNRLFGDGKTWRGLIGGILIGIVFGAVQMFLVDFFHLDFLPQHTWITVISLAVGALLGDLIKSYFKRRLGKARGTKWPLADMYDMVVGSLVLMTLALAVSGGFGWFTSNFASAWAVANTASPIIFGVMTLVAILIISPVLHRGANIIGYLLGLKDVPW